MVKLLGLFAPYTIIVEPPKLIFAVNNIVKFFCLSTDFLIRDMENLPTEMIINILTGDCVEVQDVFNFASTCSRFHNLIKHNDAIWKSKYIQMYLKIMYLLI